MAALSLVLLNFWSAIELPVFKIIIPPCKAYYYSYCYFIITYYVCHHKKLWNNYIIVANYNLISYVPFSWSPRLWCCIIIMTWKSTCMIVLTSTIRVYYKSHEFKGQKWCNVITRSLGSRLRLRSAVLPSNILGAVQLLHQELRDGTCKFEAWIIHPSSIIIIIIL